MNINDELKKIEKEKKHQKNLDLELLQAPSGSRKFEDRLKNLNAGEKKFAQLKRELTEFAVKLEGNNGRDNKTQARSSEKKSSRQEDKVYEEDYEVWEGNFVVEEASSEEELERPLRSSKAKRNASGSPKRRLVLVDSSDEEEDLQPMRNSRLKASGSPKRRLVPVDSTDDAEDLQPTRNSRLRASGSPKRRLVPVDSTDEEEDFLSMSSRLRASHRTLSSASLPEEDIKAGLRIARNLSSASLRVQEMDEEDKHALSPPRKSPKAKHKPRTSSGNMDDLITQFQGFALARGMGNPHRSRSAGGSNSRSGPPSFLHSNPYFPTHGRSESLTPPKGPGSSVSSSSVENIASSSLSNVGNVNSVKNFRK